MSSIKSRNCEKWNTARRDFYGKLLRQRLTVAAGVVALVCLASDASAARGRAVIQQGTVRSDQGTLLRGPFIKLVNRGIFPVNRSDAAIYQPAYWKPYQELGFNNVRIVVAWGSSYPNFSRDKALRALDELVEIFTSLDMYVTICGSAHDYEWFNKDDLADEWKTLGPRYKDKTNVLFELQNEPMGDPNGFFSKVKPPSGSALDLVEIHHGLRAAAPDTVIGMWGFANLGGPTNDALWAIKSHDKEAKISYEKTAVAFHYYPKTTPAYVAALQKTYPVWMTEGSDEAPGATPDCDLWWYLECEKNGIISVGTRWTSRTRCRNAR